MKKETVSHEEKPSVLLKKILKKALLVLYSYLCTFEGYGENVKYQTPSSGSYRPSRFNDSAIHPDFTRPLLDNVLHLSYAPSISFPETTIFLNSTKSSRPLEKSEYEPALLTGDTPSMHAQKPL